MLSWGDTGRYNRLENDYEAMGSADQFCDTPESHHVWLVVRFQAGFGAFWRQNLDFYLNYEGALCHVTGTQSSPHTIFRCVFSWGRPVAPEGLGPGGESSARGDWRHGGA